VWSGSETSCSELREQIAVATGNFEAYARDTTERQSTSGLGGTKIRHQWR
jgi:hypothetical protein